MCKGVSELVAGAASKNGHILTKHAAEHAVERGFTLDMIDDIIGDYTKKYYSYGEEIFARKNGNWYEVVVKSRTNKNIVSVIGGKSHTMKTIKDVLRFLGNAGRTISTIPLD